MSLGTLAIVLLAIFSLFILVFIGAYLTVHWRRRSFHHRSSPSIRDVEPPCFPLADSASKELMYFFSLKPLAHEPPIKNNADESTPEDVDVFKLKEIINGPSRLLSTIIEETESTPDVDLSVKPVEVDDVVVVMVDGDDGHAKTVFSTPCDSPVFFTPVGSPSRVISDHRY